MTDSPKPSAEDLRLHLGELAPHEVEVARAAILYARGSSHAPGMERLLAEALREVMRCLEKQEYGPLVFAEAKARAALAAYEKRAVTSADKSEAMERDHRAIHRLMELLLAEVKLIKGNGVTANNIGYLASQAKEWSGRYCAGGETTS